jgi:hypothetical protein
MKILAIDREGICVDDVFFNSTVIYFLAPRMPRPNHYHQSLVLPSTLYRQIDNPTRDITHSPTVASPDLAWGFRSWLP